jgi:dipeptidase E
MWKYILSWGGDFTYTKEIDSLYKAMLSGKNILYIPRSTYPNKYKSCYTWIQNIFPVNEWYNVYSLSDKEFIEEPANYLDLYDGIYIWWGNTFRLLKLIKETWFSQIIKQFLASNKPIYSISAWAIIMWKEIHTAKDRNMVKLSFEDCLWLNLCNNYSIVCHYTSSSNFDNEIIDYIKHFQIPVLCIPEWVWIIFDGNTRFIQWNSAAYIFNLSWEKMELQLYDLI